MVNLKLSIGRQMWSIRFTLWVLGLKEWLRSFFRWRWMMPLFLIFVILPCKGMAEEQTPPSDLTRLSLEDLMKVEIATVSGASRYEQKVTEAPSSVTIVTAAEIKKYGYRTLADILRSVRGFFVTYDRNYHYVGVRGFGRPGDYNSRILLLVDGHRINDNVYDTAPIGTEFPVDIDLIDRIEIIRGPSSSLYGNNAFFGMINIITRKGGDLKGPELSGEGGSFETYKERLSYGNQFKNGLEMLLSGSYFHSGGPHRLHFEEFDHPSTNFGVAENRDGDRFYSLFSKLSFHDFTLEGVYHSREKDIPTASFGTIFNDPRNRTTDERGYLDLRYEHTFGDQWEVMARLSYDHYDYQGDYAYDYPPKTLNKDLSWGDWWGVEAKVTKSLFERHRFTLGGEYRDNFRQDQKNYNEFPYSLALDDKRNSKIWAFYIQDEMKIFENLILNAGVRYDYYSTFGGTTNPRLALIYRPFEKTIFKLLYGTAFRAPNVYEFYYDGYPNKSNPSLKPETIHTYELAWEQYLGNHLRGLASAFYYKINDLIDQQVDSKDGLLVYRNADQIEARGLEFEIEGKWPNLVEGKISYTFQDTKNKDTGTSLTNSPKHLAKLNLNFPLIKEKLFFGLEEQYTSKRKTLAGKEADDFLITNLTLYSQGLLKGLEASVSVYNLFDRKYSDPGSTEHIQDLLRQDDRSFRLKLTYRF
jgi:outer membrane receptor for ferrienterochelin and colicins